MRGQSAAAVSPHHWCPPSPIRSYGIDDNFDLLYDVVDLLEAGDVDGELADTVVEP